MTVDLATIRRPHTGTWLADSLAIAGRNLLNYRRVPSMTVAATVQPIMTVLLFFFIFGGAILVPGHTYVNFLIPGILGWSVIIGAQGTATGLATDVENGHIQRMWSLPIGRSVFLTGRILADTLRNVFVMIIILALGFALGFRPDGGVGPIIAGIALIVVFGFAASWLFATIGLSVGDPDAASAATFPPMILLVFSSSAFVPASSVAAGWLRPYVAHLPLSAVLTAARGLMLGGASASSIIEALAWTVGLLIVFVATALRAYRRTA